jgi:multiple sugar transport system permease protein
MDRVGFALPFVIVFAVFMIVPIVGSFAMSFTDFRAQDIRSPFSVDFVGLDQYVKVLGDPTFLKSIGVTGDLRRRRHPGDDGGRLALALALNSGGGRIVSFLRVGFYAPW